jgi:hypothetical protein
MRAHDARTEREVNELLKRGGIELMYHPDLIALAAKFGFTLPKSNNDMIIRGKQHRNCVATYFDKHSSTIYIDTDEYVTKTASRLFFTKTATLELLIEYTSKCIVSTKMIQYKGHFNKDATCDDKLIAFRIALVGMPVEILAVRRVRNDKEN